MSVFLRGRSFIYDFYYRKQRYRGSFGPVSKEDAVKAEAQVKYHVARQSLFGPDVVRVEKACDWTRFSTELLDYTEANCRPNTYRARSIHLHTLAPHFRDIPLKDLTPAHVERYKLHRLAQGLKRNSINCELKTLRQLVSRAWEARHLKELPIRHWRLLPHADTVRTRILTSEEETRLLLACPPKLRAMVTLALHTGLRSAEVCGLQWAYVDFKDRLITLPPELSKNAKVSLTPMNATVVAVLTDWKSSREAEGSVFGLSGMRNTFRRAALRAGLPDVSFHTMRHTFASRLLMAGVPLVTAKELLHHSNIQMTLRYTHVQLDHLRNAVEQLSAARQPPATSRTA